MYGVSRKVEVLAEIDLFFTEYIRPVMIESGFELDCGESNILLFAFEARNQINDVTGRTCG